MPDILVVATTALRPPRDVHVDRVWLPGRPECLRRSCHPRQASVRQPHQECPTRHSLCAAMSRLAQHRTGLVDCVSQGCPVSFEACAPKTPSSDYASASHYTTGRLRKRPSNSAYWACDVWASRAAHQVTVTMNHPPPLELGQNYAGFDRQTRSISCAKSSPQTFGGRALGECQGCCGPKVGFAAASVQLATAGTSCAPLLYIVRLPQKGCHEAQPMSIHRVGTLAALIGWQMPARLYVGVFVVISA